MLEADAYVEEHFGALGVTDLVGILAHVPGLGVQAALLPNVLLDVAVVEHVVNVEVEVHRNLAVDVEQLAEAEVQDEGVVHLALTRDFLHLVEEFGL